MDDFELEKLRQEQDRANNMNALANVAGTITQGFDDVPSSHELLFGGKPRAKSQRQKFEIDDPSERQAKLFQAYKGSKEVEEYKKKEDEEKTLRDPNSQRSKAYKAFAKKRGLQIDDEASAYDVLQMMDPKKITESEADFEKQKSLRQMENQFKAKEGALDRQNAYSIKKMDEEQKLALKNKPEEKMKSLSGTDKARFDNALMVLKGIDEMGTALDNKNNTFSLVGDNDYTAAERRATEAYGRMQSGGAINKEEEGRFSKTLPGITDAKEMQRKKLLSQRDEMLSRLKTLGFAPEDIGYKPKEFTYGQSEQPEQQFEADVLEYAAKFGISPQAAQNIKDQRNSKRAGM